MTGSPEPSRPEADQLTDIMSRTIRRHRILVAALLVSFIWLLSNHTLAANSLCFWCSSSRATREWDLFYHLGGNGPWIRKRDGHGHPEDPLPDTCMIDQVHMLSRHAERYPTKNAGLRHLALLDRLHQPEVELRGSLSFLNSWTYFTNTSERSFENLTDHGPYAGTEQARNTGLTFRQRYHHLVPKDASTKFWTCDSPRDIETAIYFGEGFFGPGWLDDGPGVLEIIPEDPDRGGDTLTPGDTCIRYRSDLLGHDFGYFMLDKWQQNFTVPISKRLADHAVGVSLSPLDVYGMMEMCGFEVLARGNSPWCNVFTHKEWLEFEYGRDLLHFYRAGPGNQYGPAMGWLFLNATADLLVNEAAQDVYFSFAHDGDLVPMLAALQILDEKTVVQELPTDRVKENRQWVTSDVVPMGGRVVFERVACWEQGERRRYLRLFINDGLMRLPGLPTSSIIKHGVPVEDFWAFVVSRLGLFGEFRDVCGLSARDVDRITFLHQDR